MTGRARPGRFGLVVGVVLLLVGALTAGHPLRTGYGPRGDPVPSQVAHLDAVIDAGGDRDMQALFPEGRFFTLVLTGLAEAETARTATPERREVLLARARERLGTLDGAGLLDTFGYGMELPAGVFAHGWRLELAVRIAEVSSFDGDRADVEVRARTLMAVVGASPSPFLAGYPGQYWPCDTVVAMSALARANRLLGLDAHALITRWVERAAVARDPATGLLPHRVGADGRAVEGPRGSSQSIIQTFWPELDPIGAPASWAAFREHFVVGRAGLIGVAEYPGGAEGGGDVDSGPLVLGVSASASAVGLAAARANGDLALADQLDREADLLGARWSWAGRTSYGFGQLPVGDAFLAWGRSRPVGPPVELPHPSVAWWVFAAPGVLLVGLGVLLVTRRPRDRRDPGGG